MADANGDTCTMYRGDTRPIKVTLTDDDNVAVDLSAAGLVRFTVKNKLRDAIGDAVLAKSSADAAELLVTDDAAGKLEVYLEEVESEALEVRSYWYDVEAKLADGYIWTVRGNFVVEADVSN